MTTRAHTPGSGPATGPPLARGLYAALDEVVYLNQASLGLIPRPSVDAMTAFLTDVAQYGNVRLSDEEETRVLDGVRRAGARLLGTATAAIAVVSGASEGLNQAAALLASPEGRVVLVSTDFPCVTAPWLHARDRIGMAIEWVDDRPEVDLTASIVDAVDQRTTVVCVSAVQYATGTVVDVASVVERAHAVGAAVVVEVTQMAGAAPVAVDAWGADVAVCSGYKWLSGHGGVALLVVADQLRDRTPPILGWMGTIDPFDFDARTLRPAADARRYHLSTMAYASACGLTSSLELLSNTGIERIADHADSLSRALLEGVAANGWRPFHEAGAPAAAAHIVSVADDRRDAAAVQRRLAERHRIHVSSRSGRIRISLHGYNDRSDVEALIRALASSPSID